jgi:hypothetical protein
MEMGTSSLRVALSGEDRFSAIAKKQLRQAYHTRGEVRGIEYGVGTLRQLKLLMGLMQ